jgi:molybdopterin molybdotransferase
VFGLPGNPVSSLVAATLFVAPALLSLQGASDVGPRWHAGALDRPVPQNPHRDDFVRARAEVTVAGVMLAPVSGQESHMIVRAASANALVHVPRGSGSLERGATVRYVPLG